MALPGVTTTIKDNFTALTKSLNPVGPLVCVIATRNTPTGTGGVIDLVPYKVTNEAQAISAFGYGSQAHRAYQELVAANATNVAIVGLPQGTTDSDILEISTGGDTLTDQAFQAAATCLPDVIVPWGRGGHPDEWTAAGATPNALMYSATPGVDPTVPPFGYYADALCSDNTTPMAARVAQLVANITAGSNPAVAVLGVRPYVGIGTNAMETITASELAKYLAFNNYQNVAGVTNLSKLASSSALMGDYGPYLSVVVGEMTPVTYPFDTATNTFDWGYSNGACAYAAMIASLAPWVAPTGKLLGNVSKLRYNPSQAQLGAVDALNLVPLAINYSQQAYWVDAPTFSLPGSDFARLTTLRIAFSAVQAVRQLAQQFVGQPASLEIQNAFQASVGSVLRGMITIGALNAADYNVSFDPINNSANIDLVLTPAFEIREVGLSVSVNF